MTLKNYRDLRVWQMGMDLVEDVYLTTRSFPRHETYGLSNQMQRAAVSIPSNLAEGYARQHRKEYLQHISIARASLAELDTQLEIAERLSYLKSDENHRVRTRIVSLSKQLHTLWVSLSNRQSPAPQPNSPPSS
jgi:four helix bundle protein